MNLFSLIAALAAAYLSEPALPTAAAGPVVQALATAQVPESLRVELEGSVRWFAESVAKPLLAASDVDDLIATLIKHRDVAVQARMAIANAANAFVTASKPTRDDVAADPELIAQLEERGNQSQLVALLLQIATVDFADYYFFASEHEPVDAEQMQVAMATLVPLATEAEIWLLVSMIGVHAKTKPVPEVLAFMIETADTCVLRYRAALHATLRSWDPAWVPSIEAPAWADAPAALDLDATEIENVVAIFRAPPPPTDSLRRALSRR